jgi:hypothetical protein
MFVGNNMPISVFGGLIVFVVFLNPLLLRLFRKRGSFTGAELALILVMTLGACCVPGSGLMRTFTSTLIMPHHYARLTPGWRSENIIDLAPKRMLVDVSQDPDRVLNGFVQGLGTPEKPLPFGDVPWGAWRATLLFWLPVIVTLWGGLIGLCLVLHWQWTHHERLPYPIAQFATSMLPKADEPSSGILRQRLFWLGTGAVLVLHLNNYAYEWFPDVLLPIKTHIDLWALSDLMTTFVAGHGGNFVFRPRLYFTAIAFAYFLASDASLSLGLGPYLFIYLSGTLSRYGISTEAGRFFAPKMRVFAGAGAYLGMMATILYMGRRFFANVARRALGMTSHDEVQSAAVWGLRVAALCLLAFVVQLAAVGLDWQLAVLYTALIVVIFTVMSRVVAETGLFFIQAWWFPGAVICGVLGYQAMGVQSVIIMILLTEVLALDTREALMPFTINSLNILDMKELKVGRSAACCAVALAVGLAVAVPFVLYMQYNRGVDLSDSWANRLVPQEAFAQALVVRRQLQAQDSLETAENVSGFGRFLRMSPDPALMGCLAIGLVLVLAMSFCRMRFPKFPLHPVMFLIWHTYPGKAFAASFLVGWLIKFAVTKYGGSRLYLRLKPLMFGLIAGEMLGGLASIVIGLCYYLVTGDLPKRFAIMPG